ncbi:MAG: hypothetical protein KAU14_05070 [Thermoplasmata archaeon]|nr:hypothetical protein [Thermoplasmata archaeon]
MTKMFDRVRMEKDNEGAIGIGTLIVFIAMVLVAAIAAAVLVKTAGELQSRAKRTGQDAVDDVSGGVQVLLVEGQYDATTGEIDNLRVMIVLYSGTEPLDVGRANDTDPGTSGIQRDPGNLAVHVYVDDSVDQESGTTHFSAVDKANSDGTGNAVHHWTDNQAIIDPNNNYGNKGVLDQDSIITIEFPVHLDPQGVNQIQLAPRSRVTLHFFVGAGGAGTLDITYTPGSYSAQDDDWIGLE